MTDSALHAVLPAVVAVFGAIVGSFLNVVIHRLPLGLSVNEPRRSFCPHCKRQIPWSENIPVLSWLLLRGKCAGCGARISPRYLLVELLTAGVFLGIWWKMAPDWPQALALCVLAGLLIAATFIDFEHFIIPDTITWGGVGAGIVLSGAIPWLHGETVWWRGAAMAALGAAAGYLLLWLVVEAGKLAFGRVRLQVEDPVPFRFEHGEGGWSLFVDAEEWKASETFMRPSDKWRVQYTEATLNGEKLAPGEIVLRPQSVEVGGRTLPADAALRLEGRTNIMIIPREAMGLGDVKFIAAIGAFLGWKAVLFTVGVSSVIGAVAGVILTTTLGREKGGVIPYGPYLALAALIWIFSGPELLAWYGGLFLFER